MTTSTYEVLATCNCCGAVYTRGAWERLKLLGSQEDDEGRVLELRDCVCRSTLSVQTQGPAL